MAVRSVAMIMLAIIASFVAGWLYHQTQQPFKEQTLWYQMIWQGEKVGFMREDRLHESDRYVIRTLTEVNTVSQGQPYHFTESKELSFATESPFKLLTSFYRYQADGHFIETKLQMQKNGFSGVRKENSQTTQIQLSDLSLTLADFRRVNDWILTQPVRGASISTHLPQFSKGQISTVSYVVDNIQEGNYQLIEMNADSEGQRLDFDEFGEVIAYRYDSVIELVRVAQQEDLVVAGEVDLYSAKLLTLDQPLGNIHHINRLRIKSQPWLTPYLSIDNRQQLENEMLILDANVSAIPATENAELSPLTFTQSTQDQLVSIAKQAIAGETDALGQLTALRQYVSEYLEDIPRVSVTSIESILMKPEGDCTEHTQLFNALVSVIGFPVRTVNGLVYLGDEQRGFAGHQWSEVQVDGYWLSFDPTWNINTLSATHIRLEQDKADDLYRQIKRTSHRAFEVIDWE